MKSIRLTYQTLFSFSLSVFLFGCGSVSNLSFQGLIDVSDIPVMSDSGSFSSGEVAPMGDGLPVGDDFPAVENFPVSQAGPSVWGEVPIGFELTDEGPAQSSLLFSGTQK